MDSLDTPVSTTEPTPDTTDQAVTPPAIFNQRENPGVYAGRESRALH